MGLVLCHEIGGRAPAGLVLKIDVGEGLPVVVPHDETGVGFFGCPGWRKTAAVVVPQCSKLNVLPKKRDFVT